jgi:hypothetical protein
VGAIDVEMFLMQPGDLGLELFVADRSFAWRTGSRRVIGGRRNLQFLADRLDAEVTTLLFDEAD